MATIIRRATEIKPEMRWQSTAELQQALTTGSLPPIRTPASGGGDGRRFWRLFGFLALAILLGAGAWTVFGRSNALLVSSSPGVHEAVVTRLVVATNAPEPTISPLAPEEALASSSAATVPPSIRPNVQPSDTPPLPTPTSRLPDAPAPAPVSRGQVVFQSNRDGDYEIFIVHLDGSNLRQLTNNRVDDKYPAVSPDGRRIAYQVHAGEGERWEIVVMDIDGRNQTQLTNTGGWNRLPAWSPDGRQIAFLSDRSGRLTLHVMDADGQNVRRIGATGERDGHVSWSVSNRLVYNTGGDSSRSWRIVAVDLDGGNLQSLTGNGNWSPEWSPDGRSVVFVSSRVGGDANPGIFLINDDGSNQRLLFDSPDYEWGARWSGDGQAILFTRSTGNRDSIYMVPVSGGSPVLITDRGSYPAWVNGR